MRILIITKDKQIYYTNYIDFRTGYAEFNSDRGEQIILTLDKISVIRST